MRTSTARAVESAADAPIPDALGRARRLSAVVTRLYWLWPALLMLGLGGYHIGRVALWRDELATWGAINRSPGDLVTMLHNIDASTGLYYLIEQFWVSLFGHSLLALRLPSVLAMVGATVFVALAGRKLFGRTTGLVAGVVFATIPAVSRYAQEARGYAFAILGVAAATWLLLRALERPTALRWTAYGCCIPLTGYFHLVALTYLSAHAVIVGMRWWHRRERALPVGFVLAAVVGVLPVLPVMQLGQKQAGVQLGWLDSPSVQYIGEVFWRGLFGSSWVSYAFLALAVLPLAWPSRRRVAFEVGVMAILPIALVWLISQSSSHYFFDRYLLFTLPAWALLAANVLTSLRPKALGAVSLAVLILLGAPEQRQMRHALSRENWDAKGVAAVIAQGYRPGDGLLPARSPWEFQIDTAVGYYLPDSVHLKDVTMTGSSAEIGQLHPKRCTNEAGCVIDTPRVWLVTAGAPQDIQTNVDLTAGEKKALQQYKQVGQHTSDRMTVTLLERR
ncbi:glycosyltransferase family 39 protein [Kitasatospora sp. McL0602]|uniref:glycosyltransferase family 39 protein n=1 Tax=Kitasatospora sp. McL0602 TaxID=3439530 RepID=UPI003F89E7EF